MPRSAQCCRSVPAAVKTVCTNCVCSGGHCASVRRQSRQRLRSERRYTPYFGLFHFNGGLYGLRVPSRDCHVGLRPPRNDKLGGHCLFNIGPHFPPVQCREGHAAPLQRTAGGLCIFHSSFFSLQDSFPCAPPLQCTAESLVQLSTFHSRLSTSIPLLIYT